MKIFKTLTLLLFSLSSLISYSQIIITEVHADTPYEENNDQQGTRSHTHIGEYIELYNYSDRDISLKDWSLTDFIGKFKFPDDAVIKSGEFLIVAYRNSFMGDIPNIPDNNYFAYIFPNTVGQESKIIYQDRIILRNSIETLRLHVGMINTTNCNNFKIQEITYAYGTVNYGNGNGNGSQSYSEQAVNFPLNYDFYSSTSLHLKSDGSFELGSPTPLESEYLPEIQEFESIPSVLDALFNNYNFITWEEFSNEILLNTCPLVINEVEQSPSEIYIEEGLCFNYDASGNTINILLCETEEEDPISSTEYTAAEIEDIDSKIILYPNPTYSVINVTWDTSINGKLTEMQVSNSNGVNINITPIQPNDTNTSVDLSFYPTGLYIIRFELDSGQFISRNVIKL